MIRKEKNKYVLYTSDGTRVLGRHDSHEKALAQERAIQISKHGSVNMTNANMIKEALAKDVADKIQAKRANSNEYVAMLAKLLSGQIPTSTETITRAPGQAPIRKVTQSDEPLANYIQAIRPENLLKGI